MVRVVETAAEQAGGAYVITRRGFSLITTSNFALSESLFITP